MEYSLGSLRLFSHILPRLLANVVRIQLLPYRFTAPVWGAGGAGGPSEGGVGKMDRQCAHYNGRGNTNAV